MSHVIRFQASLLCTNCGSLNDARSVHLYTPGLGQEPTDTYAKLGDVLGLEILDFEDAFFTLRRPADDDEAAIALEVWGCLVCHRVQIARLRFERVDATHWRFAHASVVPLSSSILDEAHFISRSLEEWGPNPGDDVDRVRAILDRVGARS
jgi:hypothetical protein